MAFINSEAILGIQRAKDSFNLGLMSMQRGDLTCAKQSLEEALRYAPSESKILLNLAIVHDRIGDRTQALYYYDRGFAKGGGELYCSLRYAELKSINSPEAALDYLDAIVERYGDRSQYHNLRGEIQLTVGREADAQSSFQHASRLDPSNPYSVFNEALLSDAREGYLQAIKKFWEIAKDNPSNPIVHHNLAIALERSGRYASAIDEYEATIKIDPDKEDQLRNRIEWLRNKSDYLESRFEELRHWIHKVCEGKKSVYLDEHPEDTMIELQKLLLEKIPYEELPVSLRIAALGHDIERAFPKRIRKQDYGIPDREEAPTIVQWMSAYEIGNIRVRIGISEHTWSEAYDDGRGILRPELEKAYQNLYLLYKIQHSRNSARIITSKMHHLRFPTEITKTVDTLILNHELDFSAEGAKTVANYLRKADSASFFTVNLPTYVTNRSLEATLKKIELNANSILRNEPTITELQANLDGIKFFEDLCKREGRIDLLEKILDYKKRVLIELSRLEEGIMSEARPNLVIPSIDIVDYEKTRFGYDPNSPLFRPETTKVHVPFLMMSYGLTATGKSTTMSMIYDHLSKIHGEDKVVLYRSCDVRKSLFGYDGI
ncbi:tetratricopeptide repeat protein, partial [Candidatus Woesearchaeota archaeon]|nr:tetratricopeptide repeat protein [Candidatus Woesearchaeota archaeon]